jgi:hypothetical protein
MAEITVPVGTWVALTDAPVSGSPDAERIDPPMALVVTCACIVNVAMIDMAMNTKDFKNRISSSLWCKIKNSSAKIADYC